MTPASAIMERRAEAGVVPPLLTRASAAAGPSSIMRVGRERRVASKAAEVGRTFWPLSDPIAGRAAWPLSDLAAERAVVALSDPIAGRPAWALSDLAVERAVLALSDPTLQRVAWALSDPAAETAASSDPILIRRGTRTGGQLTGPRISLRLTCPRTEV